MESERIKMTAREFFAITEDDLLEKIKKDGYLERHINQETGGLNQSKIDVENTIIECIIDCKGKMKGEVKD
mgnify:CR=1 FL=1